MHQPRDPVSPWAFVLPVALAVCVGQFTADWATDLLRPAPPASGPAIPASDGPRAGVVDPLPAPPPAVVAPAADAGPLATPLPAPAIQADPGPDPGVDPGPASDVIDQARASGAPAPAAIDGGEAGVRSLPGPATARQAGAGESCIHRTVATRSPNGWEQALENDAPVPCTASSP